MAITDEVRKDHQILRAKLTLLEAAMRMSPEANLVLREMCWSLARMLDAHIRYEVEAFRPYSNRIQALTQERMAHEHADQQLVLRDVNVLLLDGVEVPVNRVVPPLSHLIEELREHMEEEERNVFPMVDRLASEQWLGPPSPPPASPPMITETMTVNHVLHVHPTAQEIFRAFRVDPADDGIHCLDELYWRRGIDVGALLRELNQRVAELVRA